MDTLKEPFDFPVRENTKSFLEIIHVETGERETLATFDQVIEAPNWTRDDRLIYNSGGHIYSFDINSNERNVIDSGFACFCNNDHVLSPTNLKLQLVTIRWKIVNLASIRCH
ncbi:hypothetical protein [Metabacillus halosaccharovorans]|uniref:Dipeptidylpeptidase IV N-terminal domain-containing protein n=1 Tax=Metabacillus halosaccharovorans TaxID=930124 RepID=A0ABT3DAY2_9BACI|nr:hypothetical protein [Metabacillus halosaccharovorans]MCV9884215.1 hypothetical protein [Metabacillus halosaccharovorans]